MDAIGCCLCFLWLITTSQIQAHKDGAPATACLSRFPQHGGTQPRQNDPSPYLVLVDKFFYKYNEEDTIIVTVRSTSPTQHKFKGILLLARRTTPGTQEDLVGTFQQLTPQDKLKYVSCEGRAQSAVTHENDEEVSCITAHWKAPKQNVGPITFEATLVETYNVFYVNLKSSVIQAGPRDLHKLLPGKQESIVRPMMTPIDWGRCGQDKGCLLYPRYCTDDCVVAVSFKCLDKTKVQFEMTAKAGTYVSVGFSHDAAMGNDQTLTCTDYYGRSSVQHGYNHPDKYNVRQAAVDITDPEVKVEDGRLRCRMTRPTVMENTMMPSEGKPGPVVKTDLAEQEFYLILAWGDTYLSTDTIQYPKKYPVISDHKFSLKDIDVFRGSCLPILVKVHVSLMCLAWMGFAPLAILTARYYKKGFKYKVVFETKVWLIIHSTASLLTVTLTVGGLLAIFVHLEGKITQNDSAFNHTCLGFTVFGLICILVLTSLYVPGPSSRKRPLFNFFHRLVGTFSFLLSGITLFDAYAMDVFSDEMKWFCQTSVTAWAGAVVTLVVCLEGYQYLMTKYRMRKIRSDQYDLDKISVRSFRMNQEELPEPSNILYVLISLIFLCSMAAAVCMTVLF